jgi:2-oxoglutarate dehydrogenase E1 component
MATETTTVQITLPAMGESVTEGTVLEWRKQVGDRVEADEPIVEVSTDKVDAEVPAPVSGVLVRILVGPDETVSVGTVLGEIETGASAAGPLPPASGDHVGEGELVDVTFPEMGDSVAEGTILEWLKQVGDFVEADENLVEISTDKVDAEMPSPVAGVLREILVKPDETVPVGTVLCRIESGASAGTTAAPKVEPESKPEAGGRTPEAGNGDSNATPVAARMAAANGLDVNAVPGTGPRGRVTKSDVEAALAGNGGAPAAAAPPPPVDGAETKPIRGPAATLVKFMNDSRSIPTATSFRTVPVSALDAKRRELKSGGKKLSFTHMVAWAIVQAAKGMPVMTNAYAEAEGKPQRVVPEGVSLGLAVDVERKDGTRSLVVPVLKRADSLDFNGFVAAYDELVYGARDNKLPPDAYQGANISLTNPGGIGTVASVPRLMPGQGTIVATGAIGYPPGLTKADPRALQEIGVDKVMTMTSTYDHRVIQGAESGEFLRRIDQLLQGEEDFYDTIFAALGATPSAEGIAGAEAASAVTAAEPVPAEHAPAVKTAAPDEALLQAVQAATSIVKAHRMHGHLAADLDPLGASPPGDPALEPESVNLSPELM